MTIYDAVPYSDCLGFKHRTSRRGGRAVEGGGLENRCWGYSSTEGSNPSLSASCGIPAQRAGSRRAVTRRRRAGSNITARHCASCSVPIAPQIAPQRDRSETMPATVPPVPTRAAGRRRHRGSLREGRRGSSSCDYYPPAPRRFAGREPAPLRGVGHPRRSGGPWSTGPG